MRSTPVLLIVFVVVLNRWLEMATGWSEAIVWPIVGLGGAVLIDRLVLPATARLTAKSWALNLAVAVAVGALVGILMP